ncbi:FAD-dependent oxidoreductase [Streptomyces sp. NPDC018045]|uniref:FAD-dependent oxidoreductase n=1 Tax=Streptomyces sp. NPDC018045 TaxID=3365037 RepID=UPI00379DC22E
MTTAKHYDIVVVGARCAGASVSFLLAQSGLSVLMLDAAAFPSGTMSTLFLQPQGVSLLREWGFVPDALGTGCPPLRDIVYRAGDTVLRGALGDADEFGCAPARTDLDRILVEGALSYGVEFHDRARVHELVEADGRVCGLRYRVAGSAASVEVRCSLVIGADGMRSTVARLAGTADLHRAAPASCVYYALHPAIDHTVRLFEDDGVYVSHIPTAGDQAVIAAYFPQSRFPEVRRDARRHYAAALAAFPEVCAHLAKTGGEAEGFTGTGDQQNFLRRASGPGWSLLGDAAHHKDSITALGMSDAFAQAAAVGEVVSDTLHDPGLLDKALEQCWADQCDVLMAHGTAAASMASLQLTEQRRELLRQVVACGLEKEFFTVMEGRSPLEDLMDMIDTRRAAAVGTGGCHL